MMPAPRNALRWVLAVLVMASTTHAAEPSSLDQLAVNVAQLEEREHDSRSDPAARERLLAAYNNYGVALADAGRMDDGVAQLRRALALAPDHLQLKHNLAGLLAQRAHQLLAQRKHREAQKLLDEAVQLQPDFAGAWALHGFIYYETQRAADAERAWKRSLELDPEQPDVRQRLDQLRAERQVEQSFEKLSQVAFDIRYDKGLPRDIEYALQDVLLDARREIGHDFGHYPSQKVVVLLYAPDQFRQLRQEMPEWVGGQYDGKLRLPLLTDHRGAAFRRIVWHEYTHVIVQELSRNNCPAWLNEGLADYEGSRQEAASYPRLRAALREGTALPMSRLDEFALIQSVDEAALAYEQSLSLVSYLVDRYALWRIKRLLKRLGDGAPFEEAFFREFRLTLPELEKRWREWAAVSLGVSS